MSILKDSSLLKRDLTQVRAEDILQGKVIGLYFSAGWCPPCRQFTPKLARFYAEVKAVGKPFEIVFVSRDRSKSDLEEYFVEKHGDWLAVPFGNEDIPKLQSKYEVKTIPTLRIVRFDGTVIEADAKSIVNEGKLNLLEVFENWQNLL